MNMENPFKNTTSESPKNIESKEKRRKAGDLTESERKDLGDLVRKIRSEQE